MVFLSPEPLQWYRSTKLWTGLVRFLARGCQGVAQSEEVA